MLIELGGVRLLTDPLLRDRLGHLKRHSAPPAAEVMERLDAVLISHLHHDHLHVASLRRLDRSVRMLVPRGVGSVVRRAGFTEVEELSPGQLSRVGDADVVATPAVHDDRRYKFVGVRADPVGFVVRRAERSVYFAGDTDLFDEMRNLEGTLDAALLPVWGWGPTLGPGHLDPDGAARAAARLRPRAAVPIHWGTFYPRLLRRGDRLTAPPREFAARVAELAPEIEVTVLQPGESLTLSG